jgi:hypothetical protein
MTGGFDLKPGTIIVEKLGPQPGSPLQARSRFLA